MIKTVTTEIFHKEFETNGSNPALFDCSDGYSYIVKHHQQSNRFHHLINELIAVQLANLVGVNVPDFALVNIIPDVFNADQKFIRGKPDGLGFGSKQLVHVDAFTNPFAIFDLMKKDINIVEDLIRICALDIWLRNADRNFNNTNLLVQQVGNTLKMFAIDHASIFAELSHNNIHLEKDELPPVEESLFDENLFKQLYQEFGLPFEEIKSHICNKISLVNDQDIIQILNSIPTQWNLSQSDKDSIFDFISARKLLILSQFDELLNSIGI
jgi:hypothetical protein